MRSIGQGECIIGPPGFTRPFLEQCAIEIELELVKIRFGTDPIIERHNAGLTVGKEDQGTGLIVTNDAGPGGEPAHVNDVGLHEPRLVPAGCPRDVMQVAGFKVVGELDEAEVGRQTHVLRDHQGQRVVCRSHGTVPIIKLIIGIGGCREDNRAVVLNVCGGWSHRAARGAVDREGIKGSGHKGITEVSHPALAVIAVHSDVIDRVRFHRLNKLAEPSGGAGVSIVVTADHRKTAHAHWLA